MALVFADREEAGKKLGQALERFQGQPNVLVVALPRGGVVVGRAVADVLGVPLDIVVPRKIGAPTNEEYAIGALTETGEVVWNEGERTRFDPEKLRQSVRREREEAQRRIRVYRAGLPPRDLSGKVVLLVDDGLATGLTMRAAIRSVRVEGPRRVIVAVPVAPPHTVHELVSDADEVITLQTPTLFSAIGGFYQFFPQVDDETVVTLLRDANRPPLPATQASVAGL